HLLVPPDVRRGARGARVQRADDLRLRERAPALALGEAAQRHDARRTLRLRERREVRAAGVEERLRLAARDLGERDVAAALVEEEHGARVRHVALGEELLRARPARL